MFFLKEDVFKLLIAIVVGGLIGAEREYRDKVAGFRTNIFICVGATFFTLISSKMGTGADPSRIAANIVSGVGFLGAGAILREKGQVVGLTTAATIWLTAAMGMGVAVGEYYLVGATTAIMLAVLLLFPYVEGAIGRWREARTYLIIMTHGHDAVAFVTELTEASRLRTWGVLRTKQGDHTRLRVNVAGRPAAHAQFNQALFDSEKVSEYRVF
ncbi:MAG: MgtC/SapB family protein [Anaerolineales bacterium]|nr:MgtC/SapB family protein [Anaerolineales bacterium]